MPHELSLHHLKDKFSSLFKVTAFLFRPYLEHKHNPKPNPTVIDRIWSALYYLSTWIIVGTVYLGFIYFFVSKDGSFSDLYNVPPQENLQRIWDATKASIYFNITFLVVLYFAIINHAEKTFFEGKVLHLNLSGLIKAITVGRYDQSSHIQEQDLKQVLIARRNILAVTTNPSFHLLSILTPSGWDLFGEGDPLSQITTPASGAAQPQAVPAQGTVQPASVAPGQPSAQNLPVTQTPAPDPGWWDRAKAIFKQLTAEKLDNGYLLPVICQPYLRVRILLLDPDSPACKQRGEDYVSGKHVVVKQADEYKANIQKTISNLKKAYKSNKNIELRLVQQIPQWKIILVEGEVWIQPVGVGLRSDHAPVYAYRKVPTSLYHSYWNIHESLWHSPDSKHVDLSK